MLSQRFYHEIVLSIFNFSRNLYTNRDLRENFDEMFVGVLQHKKWTCALLSNYLEHVAHLFQVLQ